jgi:Peptidase A4 family
MSSRSVLGRIGLIGAAGSLAVGMALVSSGTASAKTDSYLATYNTSGPVSTISTDLVIPSYTCHKGDALALYADAYDADADAFSGGYIDLACKKTGKPKLEVALEIDGSYTFPTTVMALGDTVQIELSCGDSGTTATVSDTNNDNVYTESDPTASSCQNAYIGDIGVGLGAGQRTLPDFHAVDYSNAEVNGSALGTFDPTKTNYYEGAANIIKVKALTNDGLNFVTKQTGT